MPRKRSTVIRVHFSGYTTSGTPEEDPTQSELVSFGVSTGFCQITGVGGLA